MTRNDRIVNEFKQALDSTTRTATLSAGWLALQLNAPEPSIRRSIQQLRRDGVNIAFGLGGDYVYREGF